MAQFVDFAFQAAAFSPFAVRADELRHLLKGIAHGLPQIQLPLRAISLREELLPLGPGCARNLLVQIRNLRLQCGNARIGVALELGQRAKVRWLLRCWPGLRREAAPPLPGPTGRPAAPPPPT